MKISMTKQQLLDFINASDSELKATDFELIEDTKDTVVVEGNNDNGEGWIEVPSDWYCSFCPDTQIYKQDMLIEVRYRNGEVETANANHWCACWVQDGLSNDIVEYRLAK
jgi:hypothetical protein